MIEYSLSEFNKKLSSAENSIKPITLDFSEVNSFIRDSSKEVKEIDDRFTEVTKKINELEKKIAELRSKSGLNDALVKKCRLLRQIASKKEDKCVERLRAIFYNLYLHWKYLGSHFTHSINIDVEKEFLNFLTDLNWNIWEDDYSFFYFIFKALFEEPKAYYDKFSSIIIWELGHKSKEDIPTIKIEDTDYFRGDWNGEIGIRIPLKFIASDKGYKDFNKSFNLFWEYCLNRLNKEKIALEMKKEEEEYGHYLKLKEKYES